MLSGLEPSSDDNNSPSIVDAEEEDTSDACVSIADSDIDDSPSDLEEYSSTREAYAKLYRMADVTIYDSYLLAFQYATRHSLTKTAFAELLQLISVHLPASAPFPKSVHRIKTFFSDLFPHASPVVHEFCSFCLSPLSGDEVCSMPNCRGVDKGQFISLPLGPQLKKLMEGMYYHLQVL